MLINVLVTENSYAFHNLTALSLSLSLLQSAVNATTADLLKKQEELERKAKELERRERELDAHALGSGACE